MSSVYPSNAREGRVPCTTQMRRARWNFSRRLRPNACVACARRVPGAANYNMKRSDDSEDLARLAAGDANALRALYERHGHALLRFSTAMCRSRQAAEDMVHDTFVALMRQPAQFDPAQGTVFGYLCGVLRHCISRHFRKERRWVALDMDGAHEHAQHAAMPGAEYTQNPADEIARSERTAALRRAMLELPLQHREVIALCDLEELPYAAVASILCCPVGTVRSRLHRARALLTIRLASLELIELQHELPIPQRGPA
jgi:RNA polymerase sigma factor (sigma-70 family)